MEKAQGEMERHSLFRERPLFLPLLAIVAGSAVAWHFLWFVPAAALLPLLLLAFLAVFTASRLPFLLALSLVFFTWGNLSLRPFLAPVFPPEHVVHAAGDMPVTVEGIVESRPETMERGSRLVLAAERVWGEGAPAAATGKILLSAGEGRFACMTGDRVRFASRLRVPRNFGLPGEFDRERYLALREIHATAFVKNAGEVILMRGAVAHPVQRLLDRTAGELGGFIERNAPPVEGGILRALLLGDRGSVPRSLEDAYTRTGVNHILSISGFHVSIIALFMFWVILAAGRTSEYLMLHVNLRRTALLLTLPVIVLYLFLSGAAPATARSVLMIGVYVTSLTLKRESDPINSLLLAAMVILLLSPADLFDISFQLSFLAFWGILLVDFLWQGLSREKGRGVAGKLLLFFLASLAATLATLLPVAYYFHRTTLTGLVSNFFIVPLMGYGAVLLGFSALPLVPLFPWLAKLLLAGAAWLVRLSDGIILFLAKIPPLPLFSPTRFDLLLFYLLVTAVTFVEGRRAKAATCGALLLMMAGHGVWGGESAAGRMTVTFLSIGQGDSALVTFPDGKRMLIDGGGSAREGGMDVGERLLAPALRTLGVDRIHWMVLSHPHPDHFQGLRFIAADFPVDEFIEGPGVGDSADYRELHRILAERRVPVRRIDGATPPFTVGGALLEPLAPKPAGASPESPDDEDMNDSSLVFRLGWGGFRVLFTGDISSLVEGELARHPERLSCTVLKVPHHGSRYSSSLPFLRASAPSVAVISAGYRNSFHLPASETLDSLRSLGITVLRTDLDGTVRVTADGTGRMDILRVSGHFH